MSTILRNHQGLDNRILVPGAEAGQKTGKPECRKRLGGLLRYYYRFFCLYSSRPSIAVFQMSFM